LLAGHTALASEAEALDELETSEEDEVDAVLREVASAPEVVVLLAPISEAGAAPAFATGVVVVVESDFGGSAPTPMTPP
jgi:hypothetical protein